jgi:hypothetical protein
MHDGFNRADCSALLSTERKSQVAIGNIPFPISHTSIGTLLLYARHFELPGITLALVETGKLST